MNPIDWAKVLIENGVMGSVLVWALWQHGKGVDRLFNSLKETVTAINDLSDSVKKAIEGKNGK